MFLKVDATQIEINPLAETQEGNGCYFFVSCLNKLLKFATNHLLNKHLPLSLSVVCVDAKINFDDNAKFRQMDIFSMEDTTEADPREVEAAKYQLNYIGMDGNIACLGKVQ